MTKNGPFNSIPGISFPIHFLLKSYSFPIKILFISYSFPILSHSILFSLMVCQNLVHSIPIQFHFRTKFTTKKTDFQYKGCRQHFVLAQYATDWLVLFEKRWRHL